MDSIKTGNRWSALYKTGSLAAATVVAFIPLQTVIYAAWPPPDTVPGWFDLFLQAPLVGLLDMDLLLLVDIILMGLVVLALYMALRKQAPVAMTLALALQFLSIAAYFSSTTCFEMMALSRQYAAATSVAEEEGLVAAGQVLLATWTGTAYNVSYVLGGVVILAITAALQRTWLFGKTIVYTGWVLGAMMLVPPTVGKLGFFLAFGSLIPTVVWLILVSKYLFVISRQEGVAALPRERVLENSIGSL